MGKKNQFDYLSRHGKPFCNLTEEEQNDADELHNLLYLLHTTPVIDHPGVSVIAKHIEEEPILSQLLDIVKSGKKWIPKSASNKLQKFEPILDEITGSQETTFY